LTYLEAALCCGRKNAEVVTQNIRRTVRIAYSRSFLILYFPFISIGAFGGRRFCAGKKAGQDAGGSDFSDHKVATGSKT
jgi:hypothetical protein